MAPYTNLPTSLFAEVDDHWLFQSVSDHLQNLLGEQWHPITNIEVMPGVPKAAKHVWYAWGFYAEVGGNGLYDYLVNHSQLTTEIIHTRNALAAIGATEMKSRFTSAIVLSKSEDAEFWQEPDSVRLAELQVDPAYPNFQAVDKDIFQVVEASFLSAVAIYIRDNSATL